MGNSVRSACATIAPSREEPISWTVRKDYQVPRKVVVRSLEVLDSDDSPDRPGMMYASTLKAMVERFDKVFGNSISNSEARKAQVDLVMSHLEKHTRRRRGDQFVQEGVVEWEQTKKVYELFRVDLNLFERIYFTVDVSESTAILSQLCSCFLVLMIVTSIVVWMVSTLPDAQKVPSDCVKTGINECAPKPDKVFDEIERVCVIVFTVEYLVRLFTVHSVRFPLLNETFLEGVLTGKPGHGSHQSQGAGVHHVNSRSDSRLSGQGVDKSPSENSRSSHSHAYELPGRLQNTMRHVLGFANLVDLFAIMPYWIEFFRGSEESGGVLVVLRILRLTRIFRVFKLGKYNEVFTLFTRVISQSVPALALMLFFISLGCCLFGTLIWFAEQGRWYPPNHSELLGLDPPISDRGAYLRPSNTVDVLEESPFYSIIHSFWYVIVTISTVGYGDLYPTTLLGKIIGALTILSGIIVLAMPIGVVGANFSAEYYRVQDEKKRRNKLKQQMKTRAQVEEEQDAALTKVSEETDTLPSGGASRRGIELCRVDAARKDIVVYAEDVDEKWQQTLPPVMYSRISMSLKKFVRDITKSGGGENVGAEATPLVSLTLLESLDVLTSRVHDAIATATSTEDLADYGLREAREARRQWAEFADRCWLYVIDMCHVEKAPDPPDFFEMKAHLELARAPAHSSRRLSNSGPGGPDAASGGTSPSRGVDRGLKPQVGDGDESAGSSRSNPKQLQDSQKLSPTDRDGRQRHLEVGGSSVRQTSAEGLPGAVPSSCNETT